MFVHYLEQQGHIYILISNTSVTSSLSSLNLLCGHTFDVVLASELDSPLIGLPLLLRVYHKSIMRDAWIEVLFMS